MCLQHAHVKMRNTQKEYICYGFKVLTGAKKPPGNKDSVSCSPHLTKWYKNLLLWFTNTSSRWRILEKERWNRNYTEPPWWGWGGITFITFSNNITCTKISSYSVHRWVVFNCLFKIWDTKVMWLFVWTLLEKKFRLASTIYKLLFWSKWLFTYLVYCCWNI